MPEVKVENLEAEMKRNKISRSDIANLLGLSYRTIHSRFNGESEWGYAECVKVRDTYFPDKSLDYLFATDDEMPKAHLSVKKIADGYAECDVRLTAGHKKNK